MKMSAISFNENSWYGNDANRVNSIKMPLNGEDKQKALTGIQSNEECQTCANRKYVDGSAEMDVSFKAPAHVSPESSRAMVSAHEQMHVSNARAEGGKENKELVSASVRIKMARCPECGVAYASGGETTTVIRTTTPKYDAGNPYSQRQKAVDAQRLSGNNMNTSL